MFSSRDSPNEAGEKFFLVRIIFSSVPIHLTLSNSHTWSVCLYIPAYLITIELQWLKQLWNHEKMLETGEVRAHEC